MRKVADYRSVLNDKSIDAVLIATPQHLHAEHFTAALEAGKHVYCEKPMTRTIEEAHAVADAVAILDHGRIVRSGATEELQRDVKRIAVAAKALASCPRPAHLLDVRPSGDEVSITVDLAPEWLAELERRYASSSNSRSAT